MRRASIASEALLSVYGAHGVAPVGAVACTVQGFGHATRRGNTKVNNAIAFWQCI